MAVLKRSIFVFTLGMVLILSPIALATVDLPKDDLTEMQRALLEEKNPVRAFEIGETLIEVHAGEPSFDFLYGLAALESAHPQEATFAFERVLINQPNNLRARLELGRAHLEMKDYSAARAEFDEVLQHDIPADTRGKVRRYIAYIDGQIATPQPEFNAYVSLEGGVDPNRSNR